MLALAIGCGGGSSKKKPTPCDGGACGDAGKDVSGEVRKGDGGADVLTPQDVARDGLLPDTKPVPQPDTGIPDTNVAGDTPIVTPDTQPVTPDTGVGAETQIPTPDTRLPDTQLPDTRIPDAGTVGSEVHPDTLPVQPDTAIPDAPVIQDAAADAEIDAPAVEAGDASDDAGESDAEDAI